MGSATWSFEDVVDGSPEEVWAWLSDLTEDDHNSEAFLRGAGIDAEKARKPSKRTFLSRDGNVIRIKDDFEGDVYEQTVTLDPAARSVHIVGPMGYSATWRAVAAGRGTRIHLEGRMGKGLIGSLMKLFEHRMRKGMEADFRGHLTDLRESLVVPQNTV